LVGNKFTYPVLCASNACEAREHCNVFPLSLRRNGDCASASVVHKGHRHGVSVAFELACARVRVARLLWRACAARRGGDDAGRGAYVCASVMMCGARVALFVTFFRA
jgi:hypothetical protein